MNDIFPGYRSPCWLLWALLTLVSNEKSNILFFFSFCIPHSIFWLLLRFLFTMDFEQFNCDVPRYVSLHVSCQESLELLGFMEFIRFGNFLLIISWNIFFCLYSNFSLKDSNYCILGYLKLSHSSLFLLLSLWILFFPLCFIFYGFYCYAVKFTNLSFINIQLAVNPIHCIFLSQAL